LRSEQFYHWIVLGTLVLYSFWSGLLILQNPGFQYDEALLVLGSVQMRHAPQEIELPHDAHSWICPHGRCFPLMTVRYVGAVKEYLCLPLFAAFGPSAEIVRLLSMLLGAFGIWGIARLMADHIRPPAAAATAGILAINPAYVDLTVFDNGTVSIWMGAMGLLALATSRYVRRKTAWAAFWLGASMGLGVWARANFLWLILAMFAAVVILLRTRILAPLSHWGAAAIGGVLAGSPFLAYQAISRGGTWEALGMFPANQSLRDRLWVRLVMFAETLLSDREHRAMWEGPQMPDWQRWLFLLIVLAACLLCLIARREWDSSRILWARAFALCLLFLGAFFFLSRIIVAEHHLIVLVPLAAIVTVLGLCSIVQYSWGKVLVATLAVAYVGSALYWQVAAVRGIGRTGGVGQWSDAVFGLAEYLQQKYPAQEVKILDWGLEDNLFVLSDGKIHSREIYGDVTSPADPRWMGEIRKGGVFLMNGPFNRQFPAASTGFLDALAATRPAVRRFTIPQRSGVPYAMILEIQPNSTQDSHQQDSHQQDSHEQVESKVLTGDPRFAKQLEGFNQIEPGGWRWTTREFAVSLRALDESEQAGARLTLQLFIPESSIQKLGAITLTARLGDRVIGSETYSVAGDHTFTRDLKPGWLKAGANRVAFALDKSVKPSAADGRELGVVVSSASLEAK
jgi:4-amino-4-deoxy-L-arabinose transferase-like glycosyltransferase